MIIRTSNESDNFAIVDLLKLSLGEGLLKKTDSIWSFKHLENPFGPSYVLLAFEGEELIGVRALMQWRWQFGDQVWVAYRAVDTATHPKHQGKGIFKILTMKALEDVRAISEAFVFNTPNDKSRPGYLKMGWKIVDKINVSLVPSVLYIIKNIFSKAVVDNTISDDQLNNICTEYNSINRSKNVLFTPKSARYLKWRYENNPMQQYYVFSTDNWYLAMYVKKHKFFNELRVVETIVSSKGNFRSEIQSTISKFALKKSCLIITTADKNLFSGKLFGNYGPQLTFKGLTKDDVFVNKALDINNWYYSLGDLELF